MSSRILGKDVKGAKHNLKPQIGQEPNVEHHIEYLNPRKKWLGRCIWNEPVAECECMSAIMIYGLLSCYVCLARCEKHNYYKNMWWYVIILMKNELYLK